MIDYWDKMKICNDIKIVPIVSCIYFLFNDIELIYIGQTGNLKQRIAFWNRILNYDITSKGLSAQITMKKIFNRVFFLEEKSKRKRLDIEAEFIYNYKPKINEFGYWCF